jgi:hypothetical protein
MPVLNVLTALFIMIALFGTGRRRFQAVFALAALAIAVAAFGFADGSDGFLFSLAGAGAALFLTLPLALLGLVSGADVVVSIALGGMLGAVQYAIVYCVATAFLSIQRMLGVDSEPASAEAVGALSPSGAGLLAFEETSALVEIEARRILRMDRGTLAGSSTGDGALFAAAEERAQRPYILPWCAKLAVATLAVLMLGTSM